MSEKRTTPRDSSNHFPCDFIGRSHHCGGIWTRIFTMLLHFSFAGVCSSTASLSFYHFKALQYLDYFLLQPFCYRFAVCWFDCHVAWPSLAPYLTLDYFSLCSTHKAQYMVLCIMAKQLHFGLICSKEIVPEVMWFVQIHAAMFVFGERRLSTKQATLV